MCTNDCHFEDKETAEAHDHLLCIATGKDLDDPNRMRYSKQEWFKTRQEMNDVFSDIPEALSNTLEVLDKVEIYSIDHGPIMPFFPSPESFGTEEQLRQKVSEEDLYKEFTSDENGKIFPLLDEGKKVFLIVIDNFRYDQWRMLAEDIGDLFDIDESSDQRQRYLRLIRLLRSQASRSLSVTSQ